jgi:hypothetical protein
MIRQQYRPYGLRYLTAAKRQSPWRECRHRLQEKVIGEVKYFSWDRDRLIRAWASYIAAQELETASLETKNEDDPLIIILMISAV